MSISCTEMVRGFLAPDALNFRTRDAGNDTRQQRQDHQRRPLPEDNGTGMQPLDQISLDCHGTVDT